MKKNIFCLLIATSISLCSYSQTERIEIPPGVVYKYCADSTNNKAIAIIQKELSSECTYSICDNVLFCGPMLWERYKSIAGVGDIKEGNMTIMVPLFDEKGRTTKTEKRSGKLIQSHEDFILFWKQVLKDFEGSDIVIRKLNPGELSYYWAIIFFDIEEPIFAVEGKSHTFLFDMDEKGNLVWIEQLK